jgi:hypothetical protein
MATTFLTSGDDGLLFDLRKFMQDNDQHIPNELANHPAARFKGGFAAIGEGGVPEGAGPAAGGPAKGSKTVPTSTQNRNHV